MGASLMLGGAIAAFVLAYLFYARAIARSLGVNDAHPTPAHTLRDGIDFVPAPMPVLLGHHFASIAGAAPIIGPVLAAQYGWVPVYLWLVLGAIFLGAVHDFTSLIASVRHEGRSIGEVIHRYLGGTGKLLFLLFAWSALLLVVAVFTLVVAQTFVFRPEVATASLLFMVLAVAFGFSVYRAGVNFVLASVVGVALLGLCLYLGVLFPFDQLLRQCHEALGLGEPSLLATPERTMAFWQVVLLVYVYVASVTPVNILLQPRDYLNSFLLYAMLGMAVIGIFVAPPEIKGEAFVAFEVEGLGPLFPILFVTVACGAISGFHAMVASGTTAKQLNRERDGRPVGYGAMLIESLLALVALLTVMAISRSEHLELLTRKGPVQIFSGGVAGFFENLGIPRHLGIGFAGLAVSAFALTSLDTATRLARFVFQELVGASQPARWRQVVGNRHLATLLTVVAGGLLLLSGETMNVWKLFGSANQLLAALAMMAVTAWLAATGKRTIYTLVPMVLMYLVAVSALVLQAIQLLQAERFEAPLFLLVVLLFVLSLLLAYNYLRRPRVGAPGSTGRQES